MPSDQRAGNDGFGEAADKATAAQQAWNDLMHPERLIYDMNPSMAVRERAHDLMLEGLGLDLLEALALAEDEEERGDLK